MIKQFTNTTQISELLDSIHDWFFDLDELLSQNGRTRVLDLREHTRVDSSFGNNRQLLIVGQVVEVNVEDWNKVGYYDINTIQYRENVLTILTGIPLNVSFIVHGLDLKLVR